MARRRSLRLVVRRWGGLLAYLIFCFQRAVVAAVGILGPHSHWPAGPSSAATLHRFLFEETRSETATRR